MSRTVKGISPILREREMVIISFADICQILPHTGRMLLLERVVISKDFIVGEFLVSQEVCEGHGVLDGELVMKGSDLLDMAAQILGILAFQHSDIIGQRAVVREYGGAKFKGYIHPRERLIVKIAADDIETIDGFDQNVAFVLGKKFIAMVGERQVAEIGLVKLVVH